MKPNTSIHRTKGLIKKITLHLLLTFFVNAYSDYSGLDISDFQLLSINPSSSITHNNNEISQIAANSGASILYSSSEYQSYNPYRKQKRKYGIMSAVFGTLSVTSIILMAAGDWEKTTTGNSVQINATSGASTTGFIISMIAFPMTIYSLIRFAVSSGKASREMASNCKVQPILTYNFQEKNISTGLKLNF